jgi:hypothetical protein
MDAPCDYIAVPDHVSAEIEGQSLEVQPFGELEHFASLSSCHDTFHY